MSAIAGIINLDGRPVDEQALRRMAEPVRHRGPDGTGFWANGNVGLAELRLNTTPEAASAPMPLVTDGGNLVLVWDGRLDNRTELIQALGAQSGPMASQSDSQLVMVAYAKWGEQFLTHIAGDFALALWDGKAQSLLCARDPIGVRLFHYRFDGKRFLFGTEIKQILACPDVPRQLNEGTLGLYVAGHWTYGEDTFYQGIQRLPGGFRLMVGKQGLKKSAFWDVDPTDEIKYKTSGEYAEHFREVFLNAVRARMRSVTTVGISLSGGLDSGSVASAAGYLRQQMPADSPKLSALFWTLQNPDFDEEPFARAVTDRYGIELDKQYADDLWAMKPVASPAGIDEPMVLHFEALNCAALDRFHRAGIRVAMTGEGGDEAFMPGYMLYLKDWLFGLRWLRLWRDLKNGTPGYRHAARGYLRRAGVPDWVRTLIGRDIGPASLWVRSDFAKRIKLRERIYALRPHSYRENSYVETRGLAQFFIANDQRGAGYSVELRHPFWGSRVVEFMSRLPPEVRIQGGREKALLKVAMSGIAPDEILARSHHGAFGRLNRSGFREKEAGRIRDLLQGSLLEALGVTDGGAARSAFDAYLNGKDAAFGRLGWVLVAEQWLRERTGDFGLPARSSSSPAPMLAHA